MFNLLIGIILGATFSPFWIFIFNYFKSKIKQFLENRKK